MPPARQPEGKGTSGYKNFLICCDESGVHGAEFYGFGSLWMPWERRGDLQRIVSQLRTTNHYFHEIKWTNVTRTSESFYIDLIDFFFRRNWLMFHALISRKGYARKEAHKDFDEQKRKRFAMLIQKKIEYFCDRDPTKRYHVRVDDPLPSRYVKAGEAAGKIVTAAHKRDLGFAPLVTLKIQNADQVLGIQIADFFLGATLADWQGESSSAHKLAVRRYLAKQLGWPDMRSDTLSHISKFNIWYFFDPTSDLPREVLTREVRYVLPIREFRPRRSRAGG